MNRDTDEFRLIFAQLSFYYKKTLSEIRSLPNDEILEMFQNLIWIRNQEKDESQIS
ncbi:hypothetical protein TMFC_90031 [Tenacibaculum maritimum]|nr:hypothetical protein TMFC_90031 [Tenacibaculum maritimum]